MARPVIYVGDTLPLITAILRDGSGNPIDLTAYTVKFAARLEYESADAFGPTSATITGAVNGAVAYALQSGDLATATPGVYQGQWILTGPGSTTLHIKSGEFEVRKAL